MLLNIFKVVSHMALGIAKTESSACSLKNGTSKGTLFRDSYRNVDLKKSNQNQPYIYHLLHSTNKYIYFPTKQFARGKLKRYQLTDATINLIERVPEYVGNTIVYYWCIVGPKKRVIFIKAIIYICQKSLLM